MEILLTKRARKAHSLSSCEIINDEQASTTRHNHDEYLVVVCRHRTSIKVTLN